MSQVCIPPLSARTRAQSRCVSKMWTSYAYWCARRRLDLFLDQEGRVEIAADIEAIDRLKFKDVKKYKDRLTDAQKKQVRKMP